MPAKTTGRDGDGCRSRRRQHHRPPDAGIAAVEWDEAPPETGHSPIDRIAAERFD